MPVYVDSPDELAGILEMGGASTQIAFAPRGDILADKFPVLIGGRRYPLYVHSYLDYGQNAVNDRIKQSILDAGRLPGGRYTNSSQPVQHPCMLRGKQAHHVNLTVLLVHFKAASQHIITLHKICLNICLVSHFVCANDGVGLY